MKIAQLIHDHLGKVSLLHHDKSNCRCCLRVSFYADAKQSALEIRSNFFAFFLVVANWNASCYWLLLLCFYPDWRLVLSKHGRLHFVRFTWDCFTNYTNRLVAKREKIYARQVASLLKEKQSHFFSKSRPALYYSQQEVDHARWKTRNISQVWENLNKIWLLQLECCPCYKNSKSAWTCSVPDTRSELLRRHTYKAKGSTHLINTKSFYIHLWNKALRIYNKIIAFFAVNFYYLHENVIQRG